MLESLALGLALLAAVSAFLVPTYFGRLKPGYSHLRHTISELGETGSPISKKVSYFGFVPIGLLVMAYIGVTAQILPESTHRSIGLLGLVGVGYVGGGVFRCDAGAPQSGSASNTLHNIFGLVEYLSAAAAFSMLRADAHFAPLSSFFHYAGIAIIICLIGTSFRHPLRGLVQRIAEALIFGGIVLMAWLVFGGSA